MGLHTTRVGVHGRNAVRWTEGDYAMIGRARIETVKMLSITEPAVFDRLRRSYPNLEFIVRLYDDRLTQSSRPTPTAFVNRMVPIMQALRRYTVKFEIHNEPNQASGLEGWGASDDRARAFRLWYKIVRASLKAACPWASLGFPGLALNAPHRDLEWLEICKDVIQESDWLGCHCYWQSGNMLSDHWGLRFKLYHNRFPNKRIEITEFGNATPNAPADTVAQEYMRYYAELHAYPYLGSASAFIASSPDPTWAQFVWVKESGEVLPVVHAVGRMERRAVQVPAWPAPAKPVPKPVTPKPKPAVPEPAKPAGRLFPETGKTVQGSFLKFYDQYKADICGLPITDQIEEGGRPAQYFERVGLEEIEAGKIQLKPVGKEAWDSRQRIADLRQQLADLGHPVPAAGVARPVIQDLTDQLPVHATKRYPTRSASTIQLVVIHHTATSAAISPRRLAEYQVQKTGKPGIGYHFMVAADGTIYQTNRLETVSDHAFARNQDSVGVIFAGDFTDTIPTNAQLQAGGRLVAWLLSSLGLPKEKVVGLSEVMATQSPGKQWRSGHKWKEKLLAQAAQALNAADVALKAELERGRQQQGTASSASTAPTVQDISAELPTNPANPYPSRALTEIKHIVIHHTGTASKITPLRLANAQVNERDKPGIAYHFFVAPDGTIYQTNRLQTVSDHAQAHSRSSIGVVFPGDFTGAVPTGEQIKAGGQLVAWLMRTLDLDEKSIVGASELLATHSPGQQWLTGQRWKDSLLAAVRANAQGGAPGDQPAMIDALRSRIATLEDEIEQLRQAPAPAVTASRPVSFTATLPVSQRANGRVEPPAIQDIIDMLPVHYTNRYEKRPLTAIDMLVVHHSGVPETVGPHRIADYQVKNQEWPGIGYHFMVGTDGTIYQGQLLETVSHHAQQASASSVGICLLGDLREGIPPTPQLLTGARLIAWLMQELGIPLDGVRGHQEVVETICPGNQWLGGVQWKGLLRQEVARVQEVARLGHAL